MADHTISDQRVGAVKEPIIKMKTAWLAGWLDRELIIFVAKFWKVIPQQIELHRVVHVNANQFARPVPESIRQGPHIRNRLIEMHRCHMKTVSLPQPKGLAKLCAVETTRQNLGEKA